jgi:diaminopimelate epimerase
MTPPSPITEPKLPVVYPSVRVPLPFTKMQGLGNDFMVLDCTKRPLRLSVEQIRLMADRHFGVGFDQLLLVEPPRQAGVDFSYRIFNADGSEVEQCGNGARCFARFVHEKGLTDKSLIRVETVSGLIELRMAARGQVVVNMGVPRFLPEDIPFKADTPAERYCLDLAGTQVELAVVNMGNPHAVLFVDDVKSAPVDSLGPQLESHPYFPSRVNVGFAQIQTRDRMKLRVFERGAGETLACGTGACAAMVAGRRLGLLDERVRVRLPGGALEIEWPGGTAAVFMSGPATTVFEGFWLWPE